MSSVRRRLLAAIAGQAGGGSIAVGSPAVTGTATIGGANRLVVDMVTPANGAGTLTVANVYTATAGTIYIMTGTISGTNYTVRAISAALSAAAGANALTISLPVVAGDYIAAYLPSTTGATVKYTSGSGQVGFAGSPASPPSAGNVLLFSTATGTLSLNGTG